MTRYLLNRPRLIALLFVMGLLVRGVNPLMATSQPVEQLLTIEGSVLGVQLSGIEQDGSIRFVDPQNQTTRVAPDDLVRFGHPVMPHSGPVLILDRQFIIPGDLLAADASDVLLDHEQFGLVTIPIEHLQGIIFRPASAKELQDRQLFSILDYSEPTDTVKTLGGDQLSGTLLGMRNERITFRSSLDLSVTSSDLKLPIAGLRKLAMNRLVLTAIDYPSSYMLFGLHDGTVLPAITWRGTTIGNSQAPGVELTLPIKRHGQPIRVTAPLDSIVYLSPRGRRVEYLSDREPTEYRFEPYLTLQWPLEIDRSVSGTQLRADKQLYLKGLGTHSRAVVTYQLDRPYKRFQAELAIDDLAGRDGVAQCRVVLDGRTVYQSPEILARVKPLSVDITINGAKTLELIIDYGARGDVCDHVDWLDARLIRAE